MDAFLKLLLATETSLVSFFSPGSHIVFETLVGYDALYVKLNVCKELAGTYQ